MRETARAAKAFADYCAMGEARSLTKLEAQTNQSGTKARLATLKEWSTRQNWQERVKQYDSERMEERRRKREGELDKMNERHALIGTSQQARALKQIEALIDAQSFTAAASVQLLKLATDLERVARGASTEQIAHTGKDGGPLTIKQHINLSGLSNEELATLEQLARRVQDQGERP